MIRKYNRPRARPAPTNHYYIFFFIFFSSNILYNACSFKDDDVLDLPSWVGRCLVIVVIFIAFFYRGAEAESCGCRAPHVGRSGAAGTGRCRFCFIRVPCGFVRFVCFFRIWIDARFAESKSIRGSNLYSKWHA